MKQALKIFTASVMAAAGLLLLKKALPLFAPFLPALAAAAIAEPAVRRLCRRGVPRSIAAGVVTAVGLGLCLCLLILGAAKGTEIITSYAKQTPRLLVLLSDTADSLEQTLDVVLRSMPEETVAQLRSMMEGFTEQLSDLPVLVSQQALERMTDLAKASPDGLLFVCTLVIGVYFFSLYYEDMGAFLRRQLSPALLEKLMPVGKVLRETLGSYIKIQCILSGVTFLILAAAFRLLRIPDSLPNAAAIAVIDALPILGAGAVLLPWALICLLLGRVPRALGLLTVYGVLLVTHNVLQAKLMGSKLGLHPVAALVSLYAGWQLGGLWGMIGLPIVCAVVSSLNQSGIIRLYQ